MTGAKFPEDISYKVSDDTQKIFRFTNVDVLYNISSFICLFGTSAILPTLIFLYCKLKLNSELFILSSKPNWAFP